MTDSDRIDDDIARELHHWASGLAGTVPALTMDAVEGRVARHRRARRVTAVAAAAVTVLVAVVAWVAVTSGEPGSRLAVVGEPSPTVPAVDAEPVTATAVGAGSAAGVDVTIETTGQVVVGEPVTATAVGAGSAAGVDVTIETAGQVVVGTRTSMTVTVRNNRSETIYWQSGGCAIPVEVTVGPAGTVVTGDGWPGARGWDGSVDTLAGWIATTDGGQLARLAQPDSMRGWFNIGCTMDSNMDPLPPGQELSYEASADIRVPPGPLPNGGVYEAVAGFVGYSTPQGYPQQPLDRVQARVEFEVVDDPARGNGTVDDIVTAVIDDGRLAAWLPTTAIPGRPDLVQDYSVGLGWWRGAWELWIHPTYNGDMLRLRVDRVTNTVIDARIVNGVAPNDEPDTPTAPGAPPDVILPHPGGPPPAEAIAEPSELRAGQSVTVTPATQTATICQGQAAIYEITDAGTRERGLLDGNQQGDTTWQTAPEASPMTIPPCQEATASRATYTVPDLTPGAYMICLTRESDACATFTIID